MYTAQVIKREEKILYLNEKNEVISLVTDEEKMSHVIMGKQTRLMVTEEVETRIRAKTKKELDVMFWNYMASEALESRNYYLVIDKN